MKLVLKIFSYIFHPAFVSVYTTLYFFYTLNSYFTTNQITYYITQISLLTIIYPTIAVYVLLRFKAIKGNMLLTKASQRRLPLAIQSIYFFIIAYETLNPIINYDIRYFFIGALFSSIIAFIAAMFNRKISLHMIGISGMASFIIGLNIKSGYPNLYLVCSLITLIGVIASSRISAKAHTTSEILVGTFVGIFTQLLLFNQWL